MTAIAVCGTKGSPGTTSVALLLAAMAADGGHEALLVEADPDGGTIAIGTGLPLDPGSVSLAAAARRGLEARLLETHSAVLLNGARVLLAPTSPARARSTLASLAADIAGVLRTRPGLVVVDGGRWSATSPSVPLLQSAHLTLVVTRPTVGGTEQSRAALEVLGRANRPAHLVCVGDRPYPPSAVAECLGGVAYTALAFDTRAVERLSTGAPLDRWLRRTVLVRSAGPLLDELLATSPVQEVAS